MNCSLDTSKCSLCGYKIKDISSSTYVQFLNSKIMQFNKRYILCIECSQELIQLIMKTQYNKYMQSIYHDKTMERKSAIEDILDEMIEKQIITLCKI